MPRKRVSTRAAIRCFASCSCSRTSGRAKNAYARPRSSDITESLRVAEHPELGDVAAEEERGRPVGDDAQLPRQERELVQVVRAGDEPAREAAQADAQHVGDPLVAA